MLASRTAVLGPDHPDTLAARHAFHLVRASSVVREIAADPILTRADRVELAELLTVPDTTLAVSA